MTAEQNLLREMAAASSDMTMTVTEWNRLRWRCRRGMLENDLVLTRFLEARGAEMAAAEVGALDRLLALPDTELWDLICGRAEPVDASTAPLVATLRTL